MTLDKDDLKAIGGLMDEKMLDFHEKVTAPMMDNIVEMLREESENQTSRLERKLDNITDNISVQVGDHEKRIVKLERAII